MTNFLARGLRVTASLCSLLTTCVEASAQSTTCIIDPDGDGQGSALDAVWQVAVDGAGNAYVVGEGSDAVFRVSPNGRVTRVIGPEGDGQGNVLDRPTKVAVAPDGAMLVTGYGSHNVFRVAKDGAVEMILDSSGDGAGATLAAPAPIAVGPDGEIVVGCMGSNNVFRIAPDGSVEEILGADGDGQGNEVRRVTGLAIAPDGVVFATGFDSDNVFRIDLDGTITTILDTSGDGAGNQLVLADQLALDHHGNLFVSGMESNTVLKLSPEGVVECVLDASGDGTAPLDRPRGLAVDARGDLWVAGSYSHNVFRVTPVGAVECVLGLAGDGQGNELISPYGVTCGPDGAVFVGCLSSDNAFRISPRAPRVVQVLDSDGGGSGVPLDQAWCCVLDRAGNAYVCGELSNTVHRVAPDGTATLLVGPDGDGAGNQLDRPVKLAVSDEGTVFVAGYGSDNVLRVTPSGQVELVVDADAGGTGAELSQPGSLALDDEGNLFVGGMGSNNVLKVAVDGSVTQILGPNGDGAGNVVQRVTDLAVDGHGRVFAACYVSDNAFRIDPDGTVTEVIDTTGDGAGNGLLLASDLEVDVDGNLFVCGTQTHNVFRVTPDGTVTMILDAAGDGGAHPLAGPRGLALDDAGRLYVAGTQSHNVFRVTPDGAAACIADLTGDGAGNEMISPWSLSVDRGGSVFVACLTSDDLFRIDPWSEPLHEGATFTDDFSVRIAGLDVDSADVRRVTVEDARVRVASLGRVQGRDSVVPAFVEFGALRLLERPGDAVRDWYSDDSGPDGGPPARDVTIEVRAPGATEPSELTFVGARPIALEGTGSGDETVLVAMFETVAWSGPPVGTRQDAIELEWEGVAQHGPLVSSASRFLAFEEAEAGLSPPLTVGAGQGELHELAFTTSGIAVGALEQLDRLTRGQVDRRSVAVVSRSATGAEVGRHNAYEVFVGRYRFPRFDRDRREPLTSTTTLLATQTEDPAAPSGTPPLFDAPYPLSFDPLLACNFRCEVEGIDLTDDVVAVEVDDLEAELLPTLSIDGKEHFVPAGVRDGRVHLTVSDPQASAAWLASFGQTGDRRAMSIVLLGLDGEPRAWFNLFEVEPLELTAVGDVDGAHRLTCTFQLAELLDGADAGTPIQGGPGLLEWSGVQAPSHLFELNDGPVLLSRDGAGPTDVTEAEPAAANYWCVTARSIGISNAFLDAFQQNATAPPAFARSLTLHDLDPSGGKVDGRNLFEAFPSRYHFPRLHRDHVVAATAGVTLLGNRVEALDPPATIFDGARIAALEPLITDRFRLELEGIALNDEDVVSVELEPIETVFVETTRAFGRVNASPAGLRFGDLVITAQDDATLADWYGSFLVTQARRNGSLEVFDSFGTTALRLDLFELAPTTLEFLGDGRTRLRCRIDLVELVDYEHGHTSLDVSPHHWEYSGVLQLSDPYDWQEQAIALIDGGGGLEPKQAQADDATFWWFQVTAIGAREALWAVLGQMQDGLFERRSHSRVEYDEKDQEVARWNAYEVVPLSYALPVLSREAPEVLRERVALVGTMTEDVTTGVKMVDGLVPDQPLLTRDFTFEIEGVQLDDERVVSVTLGDAEFQVPSNAAGPPLPRRLWLRDATIVTDGGSQALSAWHADFQSNSTPRAAHLVHRDTLGAHAFGYQLFELEPRTLTVEGEGADRRETLTLRVGWIELDGSYDGTHPLASLGVEYAGGEREFVFAMEGIDDTTSWHELVGSSGPAEAGSTTSEVAELRLVGIERSVPRSYVFDWMKELRNQGRVTSRSAVLTQLDPEGAIVAVDSFSHVVPLRYRFPRFVRDEFAAARAELVLSATD